MTVRHVLLLGLVVAAAGCGMLRVNIKGHAMSPTLKDGESGR